MRHPPVGLCIYCGDRDALLTDEHVVPYSFGGDYVLPKATCQKCQKITAKIENSCMRTMFGPARIKLGIRTRRPIQRPKTLPIELHYGNVRKTTDIPIEDYPFQIGLPVPGPARALKGLPPRADGKLDMQMWFYPSEPDVGPLLNKYGASGCTLDYLRFNPMMFFRFLAKMAHGFFWMNHRGEAEPVANGIILSEVGDPNYLIGAGINAEFEPLVTDNAIFQIASVKHNHQGLVVVTMRFFPHLDSTPIYHVLVGVKAGRMIEPVF